MFHVIMYCTSQCSALLPPPSDAAYLQQSCLEHGLLLAAHAGYGSAQAHQLRAPDVERRAHGGCHEKRIADHYQHNGLHDCGGRVQAWGASM